MITLKFDDDFTMQDVEDAVILYVLERNDWNITRTAKDLKISIRKLFYKVKIFREDGNDIPTYKPPKDSE